MMKRVIAIIMAIILCMTLIACSNQTPTQTESEVGKSSASEVVNVTSGKEEKNELSDDTTTIHSEKPTENSTFSSSVTEDTITTEKETVESKPKETSTTKIDTEVAAPPNETEKKTEESKPKNTEPKTETTVTEPKIEPESEDTPIQTTPPSTQDIERLVAEYINQYRVEQGSVQATILTGLTNVARYRAKQLVSNFSHNSVPDACNELKYGEYVDMTLYGGTEADSYYQGYNREAIGKGDWFGTAEQMAKRIAKGFKNSSGHWAYVGDSQYGYIAVGVHYNESDGKWYCCVCMSSKNYGD